MSGTPTASFWRSTGLAVLYVFLWATAFIPSRVIATTAPPLWVLVLRFFGAGAILIAVVQLRRIPWPRDGKAWAMGIVYGLLANATYMALNYEALRHLSSGMGAIIASTNPLLLAVLAPFFLQERLTWQKGFGLLLAFAGVWISMHARASTQSARTLDVVLSLLGVFALVVATIVFKRAQVTAHPLATNAIGMIASSLALIPCALMIEGAPTVAFTPGLIAALIYLIAVMSIGATLLWFWLLTHGEASRVSGFYFLSPLFGVAAGALLLGEKIWPLDGVGLVVVAAGLAIALRSSPQNGPVAPQQPIQVSE